MIFERLADYTERDYWRPRERRGNSLLLTTYGALEIVIILLYPERNRLGLQYHINNEELSLSSIVPI